MLVRLRHFSDTSGWVRRDRLRNIEAPLRVWQAPSRPDILGDGDLEGYRGQFAAIVASHVLEHLPDLSDVFERFSALLGYGGSLLLFVPNCGGRNARELGVNWGPMCCEKHPLALDSAFFERVLPQHGFSVRTMGPKGGLALTSTCSHH
jgi:hypothetical protein